MTAFDPACTLCPRLAANLQQVREDFPDYHARPVPSFGVKTPRLLIVGLAPGFHGANATGRPFTGDYAGILLYKTLHQFGFASQPEATHADDGLRLVNCRITNAVKCLPPANKPTGVEINTCNRYLRDELLALEEGAVVLALGRIAHNAVIKALELRQKDFPFAHAAEHEVAEKLWLVDSYHCSRYNTHTRRLTEKMFYIIFNNILDIININN